MNSRQALAIAAAAALLLVTLLGIWVVGPGSGAADGDMAHDHGDMTPSQDVGPLAAYDKNGDGIVYRGFMHPEIISDQPGSCPVCGMDLQPVRVDAFAGSGDMDGMAGMEASGEPAPVRIDPVTLQNMGVRTALVTSQTLARSLRSTGTFQAVDGARKAVSLKTAGWIERLYVDTEGQYVRAGSPLLELYSPELVATQEEYLLAIRNAPVLGDDADAILAAARRRLQLYDISDAQIDRLRTSGEVQRTLTLHAPASGTVTGKSVVEGQRVPAGQTLMEIVDLSRIWLQIAVPEQDLGWVRSGARASVALDSRPGQILSGRVEHVYDTVDPTMRAGTARILLGNTDRSLKPGMFATATLHGTPTAPRPVVPTEAILITGDGAAVLLAHGDGRFQPRSVTTGVQSGGLVQVLTGLTEGQRVVTSAHFLIDSEARLSSALGAMMAMPGMEG